MSICRWSDDDYRCDLYIYEGSDGYYHVHVANGRYVIAEEMPEITLDLPDDEILRRRQAIGEILDRSTVEKITLPFAGKSFKVKTLKELKELVYMLKAVGYHVPEFVFALIENE